MTHTSHRRGHPARTAPDGARGGFPHTIVSKSVLYCDRCLTPLKAKDPLSACNAAGPSNQPWRSSPMDGLRYLTYLITFSAICVPPILRIERDIATSGGQS